MKNTKASLIYLVDAIANVALQKKVTLLGKSNVAFTVANQHKRFDFAFAIAPCECSPKWSNIPVNGSDWLMCGACEDKTSRISQATKLHSNSWINLNNFHKKQVSL